MDAVETLVEPTARSDHAAPLISAPKPTPAAQAAGRTAELDDADFAVVVLQALTTMASRSKRRQADLTAALRGADIEADASRVRIALKSLRAFGAIEKLVPLSDGGLLLSVTQKAIERVGPAHDWLAVDELAGTSE